MYFKIFSHLDYQKFYLFPFCLAEPTKIQLVEVFKKFLQSKIQQTQPHLKIQGLFATGNHISTTPISNTLESFPESLVRLIFSLATDGIKHLLNESTIYIEIQYSKEPLNNEVLIPDNTAMPVRFLYQQLKIQEYPGHIILADLYSQLRKTLVPPIKIEAGLFTRDESLHLRAKEIAECVTINI